MSVNNFSEQLLQMPHVAAYHCVKYSRHHATLARCVCCSVWLTRNVLCVCCGRYYILKACRTTLQDVLVSTSSVAALPHCHLRYIKVCFQLMLSHQELHWLLCPAWDDTSRCITSSLDDCVQPHNLLHTRHNLYTRTFYCVACFQNF